MRYFLMSFIFGIFPFIEILYAQRQSLTLNIGDNAPPIKVYKWLKGKPVEEFKKGQIYIVEFGATWCHPCAEAIPHLSELVKQYGDTINVISVFVMEYRKSPQDMSYVTNVGKYIQRQGSRMVYNVAVDGRGKMMEKNWLNAAGVIGIPSTFIIDRNGQIAWIGTPDPKSLSRVIELVKNNSYHINDAIESSRFLKLIAQPTVNPNKPLFFDGNCGDGKDFLFRSILTKYHGEYSGNAEFIYNRDWSKISKEEQSYAGMVQQIGASLGKLYYLAYADTISNMVASRYLDGTDNYPDTIEHPVLRNTYGKYWYRTILEIKDTTPFIVDKSSVKNRYNYSLIVPDERSSARALQNFMRKDLEVYFGYTVSVEDRMMPCWKLLASDKARNILITKTPGNKFRAFQENDTMYHYTNAVMKDILIRLINGFSFGYASYGISPKEEAPFIDETGITDQIDYSISVSEFEAIRNGNWNAAIAFLQRVGLRLEKSKKLTKVVVVRDHD